MALDHISQQSVYRFVTEELGGSFRKDVGGSHYLHSDLAVRMGDRSAAAAQAIRLALKGLHKDRVFRVQQHTLEVMTEVDPNSLNDDNLLARPGSDPASAAVRPAIPAAVTAELELLRAEHEELLALRQANDGFQAQLAQALLAAAESERLRTQVESLTRANAKLQSDLAEAEAMAVQADDQAKEADKRAEIARRKAEDLQHQLEALRIEHRTELSHAEDDIRAATQLAEDSEARARALNVQLLHANQLLQRLRIAAAEQAETEKGLRRRIHNIGKELSTATDDTKVAIRQRDEAEDALHAVRDGMQILFVDAGCGHRLVLMAPPDHSVANPDTACQMLYHNEATSELTLTIPAGRHPRTQ